MNNEILYLAEKTICAVSRKKQSVALAESCTGGLIAVALTSVSGASAVFFGSAVTYSNEAKWDILGVAPEIIVRFGAVSAECAAAMACGAKRIYNSDIALSVTGIAGPRGGSPEKPVGTVWFGYVGEQSEGVFVRYFEGDREQIRLLAVMEALRFISEELS